MSYLNFNKEELVNLEYSLKREVLSTNRAGGYSSTTVVCCNTRKYHGLLVLPISEFGGENHVLLSSLDETVVQHGQSFNLGIHKYPGVYEPRGHKYIVDLEYDPLFTLTYRVGGVVLKKEILMVHNEAQLMIRYTLEDAHSETYLRLKPFLAYRNVHALSKANMMANTKFDHVENGIRSKLYVGFPALNMQLSKANEFVPVPDWYYNIEYLEEKNRGYDYKEDLFVPGYFEVDIKKGESIVFSAGTSEISPRRLKQTFEAEVADRTPRDSFYHCLKNSAHQYHNQQEGEHYILAGYPWFKCRARDMFIALPGLTLAIDEIDQFEDVMKTAEKAIRNFINEEPVGYKIYEMEHPDVLLWAVWALQQYAKETSREQCRQKYGELLKDIMEYIRQRKHDNLFLHENGLLYANGTEKAITWMNSTVNGHPVIPRTGYIVEFNALWYNALRFVADLVREGGDAIFADVLDAQAEVTGKSFVDVFRNEYGYLLDYVDGNMMDWSVRPNMIFTVAFDYSPLDRAQKKQVLDIVTKELLTPKGIRSLSPKSGGYNPNYVGPQVQRDYAYHQGTAWPWLMGFYLEAYLRIYKMSGLSFVERQLISYDDEMTSHCVGSIAELFDGNPPFKGRGAVSFAMNVAEILRVLKLLSKYY